MSHESGKWCSDLHCSKCYGADTWQKSELPQLRAELQQALARNTDLSAEVERLKGEVATARRFKVLRERDAALAEVERLKVEVTLLSRVLRNAKDARKRKDDKALAFILYNWARVEDRVEDERDRALATIEAVREWCVTHDVLDCGCAAHVESILDGKGE